MTRRKKLAISVVAILALAAAGVGAAVALRGPSMQSKYEQLREGMTYDEVVSLLGEPSRGLWPDERLGYGRWSGDDGRVYVFFTDGKVVGMGFLEEQPPGFLDRLRSWFGL
jgi:hypothetical protein